MSIGGRLTLSDDSHGPQAVGLHYKDAFKYLQAQGVNDIYCLSARSDTNESAALSVMEGQWHMARAGARLSTRTFRLEHEWASNEFWQHV